MEGDPLEHLDVEGMILKCMIEKWDGVGGIDWISLVRNMDR
jgi:hypothetical protein